MTKSPIHDKAIVTLQVQFCRNLTKKNPQEHYFTASFTVSHDFSDLSNVHNAVFRLD